MKAEKTVQATELEKVRSIMTAPGIVLTGISITFLILMIPFTVKADGILPADYPNAALINEGRQLFFNETFDGNGRTCGSCHPENNNFTLDAKYIAGLEVDDALFAGERPAPNPLAENFEKPELMHKLGLVLENSNGFDDPEHNYTMRSVPHLLAMRSSITPPSELANDGTNTPPVERTGWGW